MKVLAPAFSCGHCPVLSCDIFVLNECQVEIVWETNNLLCVCGGKQAARDSLCPPFTPSPPPEASAIIL